MRRRGRWGSAWTGEWNLNGNLRDPHPLRVGWLAQHLDRILGKPARSSLRADNFQSKLRVSNRSHLTDDLYPKLCVVDIRPGPRESSRGVDIVRIGVVDVGLVRKLPKRHFHEIHSADSCHG